MTDLHKKIEDYIPIVGQEKVEELKLIAQKLKGKTIQSINSTAVGGGVAEILSRMVPLLNNLGVDTKWDVIKGDLEFFGVTKKIHNALHGGKGITKKDVNIFLETSRLNLERTPLYGDIIFVHDPQPIALIGKKSTLDSKWIWRCHVDVSQPNKSVWNFLKKYIEKYDATVFSAPAFSQKLKVKQFMICPSIDPLSEKNRDLTDVDVSSVLKKYGLPHNVPLVTQVSRYDRLKDPAGVIDAYKLVRKYINCHLVLAGSHASDDPEGSEVLAEIREKAKGDPQIHLLVVDPKTNDFDVNALQRGSAVVIQKSLREGFALTVTEALWKARPVVASAVGGIPLQIAHKYSGLLCHSIEGAALHIKQFLHNPAYAKKLGTNGKEHIRQNYLLTRHLREYMLLFLSLYNKEDIVYL
ncbi:MAG: glycosyltransferase [Candidatus Omnitrophica bacterium]|nr:glycosyltransferase [Candidatus Omnitrophota bacterium]